MTYDWSKYTGNLAWLPRRTIFMCRSGSMAYGTDGPGSDEDQRGVFIPPKEYTLGYLNHIQQVEGVCGYDATSYALHRFVQLTINSNPNMIETLFTDERDWLLSTPAWEYLHSVRDKFLSQNAKHRFCGYAVSQLKKIETHRRWLLHPPDHKPTRAEYGLPDTNAIPKEQREALEAMMLKVVEGWQVDYACLDEPTRIDLLNKQAATLADMQLAKDDQYVAAANKLGLDAQAMEYLKAERAYRCALAEWTQFQDWKKNRNEVRAALEARYGYDTKHGMHLVRLLRMAREILTGKGVVVRRPDAEELKEIRFQGTWSYEKLAEWAYQQDEELDALMASSPLPRLPDRKGVDLVVQGLTRGHLDLDPNTDVTQAWRSTEHERGIP